MTSLEDMEARNVREEAWNARKKDDGEEEDDEEGEEESSEEEEEEEKDNTKVGNRVCNECLFSFSLM